MHLLMFTRLTHRYGGGLLINTVRRQYEPLHDKTNKMSCVSSEDSGQPTHPPMIKIWVTKRTAKTLIRLGGFPG